MKLLVALAVAITAATAPAIGATAVDLVANGGFELAVPLVRDAAVDLGLEGELGLGHQLAGCTRSADILWGFDCHGRPIPRTQAALLLAEDPEGEAAAWTTGRGAGDVAYVAPFRAEAFRAVGWSASPPDSVDVRDADGDGDREAVLGPESFFLLQGYASGSLAQALPFGSIAPLTFEATPAADSFVVFGLDAFPFRDPLDAPQVAANWVLVVPAARWTGEADRWSVDPVDGRLSDPIPAPVGPATRGPDAAAWDAASRHERREILGSMRLVTLGLARLARGTTVDDVQLLAPSA